MAKFEEEVVTITTYFKTHAEKHVFAKEEKFLKYGSIQA
jgi:hypothetical protein